MGGVVCPRSRDRRVRRGVNVGALRATPPTRLWFYVAGGDVAPAPFTPRRVVVRLRRRLCHGPTHPPVWLGLGSWAIRTP
jgi:hypothetical protein